MLIWVYLFISVLLFMNLIIILDARYHKQIEIVFCNVHNEIYN